MPDASGLVPNISLGVNPPQPPAQGNALGMLSTYADIQNKFNENKLFQQSFAARQKAGQIIASSPDLPTAVKVMQTDPLVASFAPELTQNVVQTQQALAVLAGTKQGQNETAMQSIMKASAAALADPSMLQGIVDRQLKLLPPDVQANVGPVAQDWVKTQTDGLPQGQAGLNLFRSRLTGAGISAAMTPESLYNLSGTTAPQWKEGAFGQGGATKLVTVGGLGGQPTPEGPTQAQQAANTATGAQAGTIQDEMNARAEQLPNQINKIDQMIEQMKHVQTGGGADFRANAAKFGQFLQGIGAPITDEEIDKVGNGAIAPGQALNTMMRSWVVRQLSADSKGQGRTFQIEAENAVHAMDNTTDPRAIVSILNNAKKGLQIGYDQGQKYITFQNGIRNNDPEVSKYGPAGFYQWYNDTYKGKLPEEMGQPGSGVSLAPTKPEVVKGGTGNSGPHNTYNSKEDVAAALKARKLTYPQAKEILNAHPEWFPSEENK